jgi:FAD synthase
MPALSKPWFLRSIVVRGHQRGGTMLGFPTANMFLRDDTIESLQAMENGVFYGWGLVEPSTEVIPIVLSVGHNPHFSDKEVSVEAYFVRKFDQDFYGATIRVLVLGKLREQQKYNSLEALIDAIKGDVNDGLAELDKLDSAALKKHDLLSIPMKATAAPVLTILEHVHSSL